MKKLLYSLFVLMAATAAGCIEDGFTTAPSDAPVAGTDTVRLGTVFTARRTPAFRFSIHNRADKSVSISHLAMGGDAGEYFRLCVDGFSGSEFAGLEIRANDSILVLLDALLPEGAGAGTEFEASVDFEACGVRRSVRVEATGRDAVRLDNATIGSDTRLTAGLPYLISGDLTVAEGATLTIEAGTEMCFHDDATLHVKGGLRSLGTAEHPVTMSGDRTGNVVGDISFDIMSRQWNGIVFENSAASLLSHTDVRNTWNGVRVQNSGIELINCRLHNAAGAVLTAIDSQVDAAGCELAESGLSLVCLYGGKASFNHCTFANNYLFSAISGPAIDLCDAAKLEASFTNCIIYGLGSDLSHSDLKGYDVRFERCLLRSAGSDDDNFLRCLWNTDPMYYTDRSAYLFDYRLRPESPAAKAADPALTDPRTATDAYGVARGMEPALGAYAITPAP